MGTISITTPSDGQTIDASDVATPLNTIVTEINGSLDSNNIADGGVVPNSLTSGTGTSWTWQDWTPTYSNITVGNGTVTAKYTQIGKTVTATIQIIAGTTTSFGTGITISLPVTANSRYSTSYTVCGTAVALDVTVAGYTGITQINESTSVAELRWDSATAAYTTAFPFTEGDGDVLSAQFIYEAA